MGKLVNQKIATLLYAIVVLCVSLTVPGLSLLTQHGLGADPHHGVVPSLPRLHHAYLLMVLDVIKSKHDLFMW